VTVMLGNVKVDVNIMEIIHIKIINGVRMSSEISKGLKLVHYEQPMVNKAVTSCVECICPGSSL
jgi:hypothetical protein